MTDPSNIEDAIAAGAALASNVVTEGNAVVLPPGYTTANLEQFESDPRRMRGIIGTNDVSSFRDAWIEFRNPDSVIYLKPSTGSAIAVIDHGRPDDPKWGEFCIRLIMEKSREWIRWRSSEGVSMTPKAFGELIEDEADFIVKPDAATLLEVALSLKATRNVEFRRAESLTNGDVQFLYEQVTSASGGPKGALTVPETFVVGLPVYKGQKAYPVTCRLRYSITEEGKLTFKYRMAKPADIEDAAFDDVMKQLAPLPGLQLIASPPSTAK